MVMRALGYDQKVAVVQFIKGEQLSGEELYLRDRCPEVAFYQMGTGFTWDTQDRTADMEAAERTWAEAARYLKDASYDLVEIGRASCRERGGRGGQKTHGKRRKKAGNGSA